MEDWAVIKNAMKQKSLTMVSVARAMGWRYQKLSVKLNGMAPFALDEKIELCKHLDIPLPQSATGFRNPYKPYDFEKRLFTELFYIKEMVKLINKKIDEREPKDDSIKSK